MLTVACPGCQKSSRIPDEFAGREVLCKRCGHKFLVQLQGVTNPGSPANDAALLAGLGLSAGVPMVEAPPAPPSGPNASWTASSALVDYLVFRRMITPIFIQIIYWLATAGVILLGVYFVIDGATPQERESPSGRATFSYVGDNATRPPPKESDLWEVGRGMLILVAGPFVVRFYCELLILFFRMNETLAEIRHNTTHRRYS
jgi:DNA-directed RNA polymerase subunit RPC12/RpoP